VEKECEMEGAGEVEQSSEEKEQEVQLTPGVSQLAVTMANT
jgi:hypothetical protein